METIFNVLTTKEIFEGGNLVMLVGPPGSGKSTLANKLKKTIMNFEIISPDDIREELVGDRSDQDHNTEVFSKVYSRMSHFLSNGYNVIYDATNCRSSYRAKILKVVGDTAKKKICIVMTTPISTCLEQNNERDCVVPENIVENMYFTLKKHSPSIFEGFDVVMRYNNDK